MGSKENFLKRANIIYGNKYDYSKVIMNKQSDKICIICPEHGEFYQRASSHLEGKGCPECGRKNGNKLKRKTLENYISDAKRIHGDKYDYSKVIYNGAMKYITIICPEHGEFSQRADIHLGGAGCPLCGREITNSSTRLTTSEFIEKAKEVHGDKYDYSKVHYQNSYSKVEIICPIHGSFWQRPNTHLDGKGCMRCADESKTFSKEDFIKKAQEVHGNKYDYSKTIYKNAKEKILITCPTHGDFYQAPHNHLAGRGCPVCAHTSSKGEQAIYEFLVSKLGEGEVFSRDRSILANRYELDIFIPSKKIAIEYDGLIWHSEKFGRDKKHLINKTNMCKEQGIRLIHIFEDEWIEHPEIVKDKLCHYLGINKEVPIIGARKCKINEIEGSLAKEFMNKNHIQGFVGSTIYLGAFYGDLLMGVMSFKSEGKNSLKWDLNRFATNNDYRIPGLANKLFQHFIRNYKYEEIKSFLDLRWNLPGDTIYEKMGFELEKIEEPDYYYVIDNKRVHKFNCRKNRLHKEYGVPLSMTEKEMCDELGFFRVYNCGLAKYVYKNPLNC